MSPFGEYTKDPIHWKFELPFKTKDEYLAWRADWRKKYKMLSEAIRLYRQIGRKTQSFHDTFAHQHDWRGFNVDYDAWKRYQVEIKQVPEYASLLVDEDMAKQALRDAMKAIDPFFGQDPCNINWLHWARKQATWMLAQRKASKIEAGRQRQAMLEQQRQNQAVTV